MMIINVAFFMFIIINNITTNSAINTNVINDNYCDRTDGSDETMTSACSNFPVKFTCSDGKLLFTSRVNDGVCDCCDGGDEYDSPIPLKCTNVCNGAATKHSILYGSTHTEIQYPLSKQQVLEITKQTDSSIRKIDNSPQQDADASATDTVVPGPTRFTIKLDKQKILLANRQAKESESMDLSPLWMFLGGILLAGLVFFYGKHFMRSNSSNSGPILATYNNYGGSDPIYLHNHQRLERGYAGTLQTVSFFVSGVVRTAVLRASQCCTRDTLRSLWAAKPNAHTV